MNHRRFLGAASAALMIVIVTTLVLASGAWAQSKYKTLYKFKGRTGGGAPFAGLIFDQAGNLYGTTTEGGDYGSGTVFELRFNADGSWKKRVLYDFTGKGGARPYYARLIFDQAGNLYG